MGKLQLIFDTNLDWHTTLEKAKQKYPSLEPTVTGLIHVAELNIQISPKGRVVATVDLEAFGSYMRILYPQGPVFKLWKELHEFCLTENGQPCEWELVKVNPLSSLLRQIYSHKSEKEIKSLIEKSMEIEIVEREDGFALRNRKTGEIILVAHY